MEIQLSRKYRWTHHPTHIPIIPEVCALPLSFTSQTKTSVFLYVYSFMKASRLRTDRPLLLKQSYLRAGSQYDEPYPFLLAHILPNKHLCFRDVRLFLSTSCKRRVNWPSETTLHQSLRTPGCVQTLRLQCPSRASIHRITPFYSCFSPLLTNWNSIKPTWSWDRRLYFAFCILSFDCFKATLRFRSSTFYITSILVRCSCRHTSARNFFRL